MIIKLDEKKNYIFQGFSILFKASIAFPCKAFAFLWETLHSLAKRL